MYVSLSEEGGRSEIIENEKAEKGKNKRLLSQYKMKAAGKAIFMYKYGQPTHLFSCIQSTFFHVQSKIHKYRKNTYNVSI